MDTIKDTNALSRQAEEKEKLLKPEKNVYDIIHSKELDLLYKKNAHLLARLSSTGKENTRLYSRLSSLTEEKSYLGDKNTVLKSKFLDLKEQISLFARQHREFNRQSHQLKKELEEARKLSDREDTEGLNREKLLKQQEGEIRLLKKKEQVYRTQIGNLQNSNKKEKTKKQAELQALKEEYNSNIQTLEEKIQQLNQALGREKNKNTGSHYRQELNNLKTINQSLSKKSEDLEKELENKIQACRLALKEKEAVTLEISKIKKAIKQKEEDWDLKTKNLQEVQKANKFLRREREEQVLLMRKNEDLRKKHAEKMGKLSGLIREKEEKLALTVKNLQEVQKANKFLRREREEQVLLREKSEDLRKKHVEKMGKLSSLVKEKEEELSLTIKNLQKTQKENNDFKIKENKLNRLAEKLEAEEQSIAEEHKKIKVCKKEIQAFKNTREELLDCKNQITELIKQKEQLKSSFTSQINLFIKERSVLKLQCESFKKALSSGKFGFDQAMLSFQTKYNELYQNEKALQKNLEKKTERIKNLEEKMSQADNQLLQERQESENQIKIKREKEKQISEIYGKLKTYEELNQDLKRQIHDLKTRKEDLFLNERQQMQEEIKRLRWNKDKNLLYMKENQLKETEKIKFDYERRIKNLEASFKKKLQHIRIEMENDLCSEKKRYEIFKDMKDQQIEELKESLVLLQKESHELKTKKFVLEKSLTETQTNLNRYLKDSKRMSDQNDSLKSLWQDLQKQVETRDQQISSLQKLNRSLSLSLNQSKKKENKSIPLKSEELASSDQVLKVKEESEDNSQPSSSHVLADIHFR